MTVEIKRDKSQSSRVKSRLVTCPCRLRMSNIQEKLLFDLVFRDTPPCSRLDVDPKPRVSTYWRECRGRAHQNLQPRWVLACPFVLVFAYCGAFYAPTASHSL